MVLFSSSLFQKFVTVRAVDTVNTARAVDTIAIANTVGTIDTVALDTVVFLRKPYRLGGVCVYWFTIFCFSYFILFFCNQKCALFFCC